MSSPPMRPPKPDDSLAYATEWARGKMNDRVPIDCPLCRRKIQVARRRPSRGWGEVLVAMYAITRQRRKQWNPFPWIHVEEEVIRGGMATSLGRDWSNLQHLRVITRETTERDPREPGVGMWRLTPFGVQVVEQPKAKLVPKWVDTWNGRAWKFSADRVSLQSMLGREFSFAEEVKRLQGAA